MQSLPSESISNENTGMLSPAFSSALLKFGLAAAAMAGSAALAAPAAAITFVQDGVDGQFSSLVSVDPGAYGFEGRGGDSGGFATWELGVGTQTSFGGSFNQANFDWSGEHPFQISWIPDTEVSVSVGDTTITYGADWQVGNAIRVLTQRSAQLNIVAVDGVALAGTAGSLGGTALEKLYIAGDSLLDGWTLSGTIAIAGGGNSRNSVRITSGNFRAEETAAVPEPGAVAALFTLAAGVVVAQRRRELP